jgi:hypothetical protein
LFGGYWTKANTIYPELNYLWDPSKPSCKKPWISRTAKLPDYLKSWQKSRSEKWIIDTPFGS